MGNRKMLIADFGCLRREEPLFAGAGTDNRRRRLYLKELLAQWVEAALTEKQRETVELYYYEGMTMEAIARQMGIAPSSVHRRLAAARRRLQKLAEGHMAGERLYARMNSWSS